jgi:hypothetical protein
MLALVFLAALPLALARKRGSSIPSDGMLLQHVSSSWMTRTGEWLDVCQLIAGDGATSGLAARVANYGFPDEFPRLNSTLRECPIAATEAGSVSFSAPAADVLWEVFDASMLNESYPHAQYRLFVDGEEHKPRWQRLGMIRFLSSATPPAYGWHNFTIDVAGQAQVLDAFIDTSGPGG